MPKKPQKPARKKSKAPAKRTQAKVQPAVVSEPVRVRKRLTGGEIVAEHLIRSKVPYVVGVPGHANMAFLDALVDRKDRISVVQVMDEGSAVHIADAYYRVSGAPLAATSSASPGTAKSICGVAQAYVDSSAVLVVCGSAATYMRGRNAWQEISREPNDGLSRVMEPICKQFRSVNRVDELPAALSRAFNVMMAGRRGPVVLDLPMDVQADSTEVELSDAGPPPLATRTRPDAKVVEQAASLLSTAKRPVIVAGGGVVASDASGELQQLAEHLGAAVLTSWMGKGAIREDHPLYAWHPGDIGATCANELARTADVILALGTRFVDASLSDRRKIPYQMPRAKLIQVDIDPSEIGRNYPPEIGIVADARATLIDLLADLQSRRKPRDFRRGDYYREIQALRAAWLESCREGRESPASPVFVSRALKELREILKPETIVVTGAGLPQSLVYQQFPVYLPRTHITSGGFSTLGFTVPGAIGAQLAAPKQRVVGLAGDWDFLGSLQELGVAVQNHLPIVYVVFNNGGWQSMKCLQVASFGKDRAILTEFIDRKGHPYTPNYAAIASAFGAHGERIDKPTEIHRAVRRALESGCTSVVEIITNRGQHTPLRTAPIEIHRRGAETPGKL